MPSNGFLDPGDGVGSGEPHHATAFGQKVRNQNHRAFHVRERVGDAAHEQDRHQAGIEAARSDDGCVELTDGTRHRRMDRDRRLEPDPPDEPSRRLRGIDFDFAARRGSIAVFGAHRRLLDADRPDAAAAAEQGPQAIDSREKIAAIALHHRQEQIAAGVTAEPRVLERRQPRQQDPPRLP